MTGPLWVIRIKLVLTLFRLLLNMIKIKYNHNNLNHLKDYTIQVSLQCTLESRTKLCSFLIRTSESDLYRILLSHKFKTQFLPRICTCTRVSVKIKCFREVILTSLFVDFQSPCNVAISLLVIRPEISYISR